MGLLAVGLPACQRLNANGDLRQSPGSVTSGDGGPQVIFYPSAGGPPVRVRVELARTPAEQERGLMFRRSLDADAGMLFLFDRLEIRRFWMRNCYIPLDMIFLDEQKVVVGIEENTLPLDESSRGPDRPAQYVIEVEGGYARRHGFGPGTRVEFRNVN